jgi:DNA polymerase
MLVGESPSATDDSTGLPFTGPAGDLLDELLEEAGISRDEIWITNLLRCFESRQRDGRVENQPARQGEIRACKRWLDLEVQYVDPRVILAVGAPAAKALIAADFKLTEQRGVPVQRADGRIAIATLQPAYVMRLRSLVDESTEAAAREHLVADLRLAVRTAAGSA